MAKIIEVDDDIYELIRNSARGLRETESTVLRRIFKPNGRSRFIPAVDPQCVCADCGCSEIQEQSVLGHELVTFFTCGHFISRMVDSKEGIADTAPSSETKTLEAPTPAEATKAHEWNTSLAQFVSDPAFKLQGSATDKYLKILGFAFTDKRTEFERILGITGRGRQYFGRSEKEITDSGQSTHPQQIPGTSFWALTNASTLHKRVILEKALKVLGYEGAHIRAACSSVD